MRTLDRLVRLENLTLAWERVQNHPSPAYKNYFRGMYSNFALAERDLLAGLQDRLSRGVFRPAHACKVYLPKATGGLRPHTLLTVEDQVIYQAFANVIADQFLPRVRDRYLSEVFSYLYAGPASPFFYRRWQDGFAAFNRAQRRAYREGLRYTARFDLTACFDSLDHHVLEHFLLELGCDQDFCRRFRVLLSYWTSTGLSPQRIYQGHGIPQGPLSSGLIAEVVLHHFDRNRGDGVRYMRYVDDIRLYARSELDVRRAVYELDLLSKEVGLFPQTAKIEIHKVANIEDELKSVSRPDDDELDWGLIDGDQDRLHGLLTELSPRFRVSDTTRFKYLLGRAVPRSVTNARLWRVMQVHPDLYEPILAYFRRYARLPNRDVARLVSTLQAEELHGVKIADLVRTADGRIGREDEKEIDAVFRKHWRNRDRLSADLTAVLGRWGIKRDLITTDEIERAVCDLPDWYARAELVAALDSRAVPQPRLNTVLFDRLNDGVSDVAVAAAVHLGLQETAVDANTPMHVSAGPALAAFGVLEGEAKRACGIHHAFERLLGGRPPLVDWPRFFGRTYRRAEVQAVRCSGYLMDPTAWVNAMDVFCDWLVDALFRHDPFIGRYELGKIGSVLNAAGRFAHAYPRVFKLAAGIHDKRGESDLSHPKKRKGNIHIRPTSRIPHQYFKTAKKLVRAALTELAAKWPIAQPPPRPNRSRS